jgi:hypothetical protein
MLSGIKVSAVHLKKLIGVDLLEAITSDNAPVKYLCQAVMVDIYWINQINFLKLLIR